MNISKEQVESALHAGMAMTDPGDDRVFVAMKHAGGALILRSIMAGLLQGELAIVPTMQEENPPAPPAEKPPKRTAPKPKAAK